MFLDTVSLQKNTMMFKWDQMLIAENQGYCFYLMSIGSHLLVQNGTVTVT